MTNSNFKTATVIDMIEGRLQITTKTFTVKLGTNVEQSIISGILEQSDWKKWKNNFNSIEEWIEEGFGSDYKFIKTEESTWILDNNDCRYVIIFN